MTQTTITAERRILAYEPYNLPLDEVRDCWEENFCPYNNPATIEYIHNLTVRWQDNGQLGTRALFAAPDGAEYSADLYPPCRYKDDWDVEISRVRDEKDMRRGDTYWQPEGGPPISFQAVGSVLVAASAYLMDGEDNGYPD